MQDRTGSHCSHVSSCDKHPSMLSNAACDTDAACLILCCLPNTCLILMFNPQQHTGRDPHKAQIHVHLLSSSMQLQQKAPCGGNLRSPYKDSAVHVPSILHHTPSLSEALHLQWKGRTHAWRLPRHTRWPCLVWRLSPWHVPEPCIKDQQHLLCCLCFFWRAG